MVLVPLVNSSFFLEGEMAYLDSCERKIAWWAEDGRREGEVDVMSAWTG